MTRDDAERLLRWWAIYHGALANLKDREEREQAVTEGLDEFFTITGPKEGE